MKLKRRKTSTDDKRRSRKRDHDEREMTIDDKQITETTTNEVTLIRRKTRCDGKLIERYRRRPHFPAKLPKHRPTSDVWDTRSATHENTTRSLVKRTNERQIHVSERRLNDVDYTQRLLDGAWPIQSKNPHSTIRLETSPTRFRPFDDSTLTI